MANSLILEQVSPPSNPDTFIFKVTVSGNYTQNTPDPLPLFSGANIDPLAIGWTPPPSQNLAVTPGVINSNTGVYQPYVQRIGSGASTTFGLRWNNLGTGADLVTGAYPAAITGGEIFLEVRVNIQSNS